MDKGSEVRDTFVRWWWWHLWRYKGCNDENDGVSSDSGSGCNARIGGCDGVEVKG